MEDRTKTKKQLIEELLAMRRQLREVKAAKEAIAQVSCEGEDIFQAIGHPAIILDAQHNILSVNRATVKAVGAGSAEELIGRKCYEIFHDNAEPPKGCPFLKMLASATLEESDMEVEVLGGIFHVSCTPVFDEKGTLQKIIHIAIDITEYRQAEEALRLNESRISSLLELSQMTNQPVQSLTEFTLEKAIELTRSTIGYLSFLNENQTVLTMYSWSRQAMEECMIQQKPLVYPVETTGLWGEAVRQQKPIITKIMRRPTHLRKDIRKAMCT